jgi:hypothetical protein
MSENTITAGDENVLQGKPTLTVIGMGGGEIALLNEISSP